MTGADQPDQPFEPSKLMDLIQNLMIGPIHDQIGALRQEALDTANIAVRLAADAELRSSSTGRKVEEELAKLQAGLASVTEILGTLAYSHSAMHDILIGWLAAASGFAALNAAVGQSIDPDRTSRMCELWVDCLGQFVDLASLAASAREADSSAKLSESSRTVLSDFYSKLRAICELK